MRKLGIIAVLSLIALVVAAAHSVGGKAGWSSDLALLVAPIHRTTRKRRFFDHSGRCI